MASKRNGNLLGQMKSAKMKSAKGHLSISHGHSVTRTSDRRFSVSPSFRFSRSVACPSFAVVGEHPYLFSTNLWLR